MTSLKVTISASYNSSPKLKLSAELRLATLVPQGEEAQPRNPNLSLHQI